MDSMINTSKSGEVKFFKAIAELKNLPGNNGQNNDKQQFLEQIQQPDEQNVRGRTKNRKKPGFLC